jgi:hypothetical protein
MKIEQLLVQHFYNARKITLQGMGTFTLSPDFVLPAENEKDLVMPENAVMFEYNSRATEDDDLINYIVQQTRKIKPLASADLDSYLVLGKQFLNIGKPFRIEGLGKLEKNQSGQYEFMQGSFSNTKKEVTTPVSLREKDERDEISFAAPAKKSAIPKKGLIAIALLIGVLMIGAVTWYFFLRHKPVTEEAATLPVQPSPDTSTVKTATLPDSVSKKPAPAVNDGYTFKVVFKETINKAAALERMNELTTRGHKVIMYTSDSVKYKLAEPFTLPLGDTARIKDSLNRFYYLGKAYIEAN